MKRIVASVYIVIVTLLLPKSLVAQQSGIPTFGSGETHDIDTIDLMTLTPVLNIPLFSKPGLLPFDFQMSLSSSCSIGMDVSPYTYMECSVASALTAPSMTGISASATQTTQNWCQGSSGLAWYNILSNWVVLSADGLGSHYVGGSVQWCGGPTSFTGTAIDGSGYTLYVSLNTTTQTITETVWDRSGNVVNLPEGLNAETETDPHGNTLKVNSGVYTDTFGLAAFTDAGNTTFQWEDTNSNAHNISLVTGSGLTIERNLGCVYTEHNGGPAVYYSGMSYPDGTNISFTMESGTGGSGTTTGRLGGFTLRTGGTVSYTYGALIQPNGCYAAGPAYPSSLTRTTSDGSTTYTMGGTLTTGLTTTVLDPGMNKTVYTFTGMYSTVTTAAPVVTQVQRYQNTGTISSPSYTIVSTDLICYNGTTSNCASAQVTYPVTQRDTYHTLGTMSTSSRVTETLDAYGNTTSITRYDFGATSYTTKTTTTYGSWNGSSCASIGNYINDRPCDIVNQEVTGGHTYNISESRYTYNSTGSLLTTYLWNGLTWLSNSTPNSYNPNGTVAHSYDVANNPTGYTYSPGSYTSCGSCTNYPFPTSVSAGGLTISSTWNGTGGVKISDTDASGNTTIYGYTDPWNRVTSIQDPLGSTVYKTYSVNSISSTRAFLSSVNNTTITLDGYGRPINTQTQQGPDSLSYDTVSAAYSAVDSGNPKLHYVTTNIPCPEQLNGTCGGTNQVFMDMLNRVVWSSTPATGEYVSTAYLQNDVLSVLGPAPSGENLKQVQKQYDGLGRLSSTCEISTIVSGSTPCGQANGTYSGVLTSTSYSSAAGSQTVSSTRGSQVRIKTVDGLGRVISSTTPEGGTVTSYYDTVPSTCSGGAVPYPGKLIESLFQDGNWSCYEYDSLGRVTAITGVIPGSTTLCRRFYYDNSNGATGTIPSGITISYPYGRLVEAETDACNTWPLTTASIITDEWFSYDKDGHMTDLWELTPHSAQYYHSRAAFAGNGIITSLQLVSPSLYTMNYGLDGEGRWDTLSQNSTSIVTGPTYPALMYNAAGQAMEVDLTAGDKDLFSYSAYTGNMSQYEFEVAGANQTGVLMWNPNNTLQSLTITDGFNSGGSQTCASSYDDLARLAVFDCGSGNWGQDFGYDQYDNLTQTVMSGRSGSTWNPGYSSANNHVMGATYDASGDMTNDGGMNVYGYNWFNKLAWTASSGTPTCGTNGKCITYDAFGRMVEKSSGAAWSEIWYTQVPGSQINMSGATANYGYWPSPGRGTFVASGTNMFLHQDWLGNDRIRLGDHVAHSVGGQSLRALRRTVRYLRLHESDLRYVCGNHRRF